MSTGELTAADEKIQSYTVRITELDCFVGDPSRLALLTALEAYRPGALHFGSLQRLTGLSKGNISNHIGRLEHAGVVEVERKFVGKRPRASVELTEAGASRVLHYWTELDEIRDGLEAIEEMEDRR